MPNFKDLLDTAHRLREEADAAAAEVTAAMLHALERLMPPGTILDRRNLRQCPEHAVRVTTVAGKDHGTRVFRVEKIRRIDFDPRYPELARWIADATPISEKTGKDMNGRVAHSSNTNGTSVTLCGDLVVDHEPDEPSGAVCERLVRLLEFAKECA